MKAVVYQEYGAPEVLKMTKIDQPTPKANEVMIRIYATTVTAGDWRLRKADPFIVRLFFGLFKPKYQVLGHELAGEVVAVGDAVKKFRVGDQVFGSTKTDTGTYAEYYCISEDMPLVHLPKGWNYEEAASIPVGAQTALHFLKQANIQNGQKVLIHGASGSVGTAAVQLAKCFGAEVTGVCSTGNVEMVKSLGASHVIDYKKEDFAKVAEAYDVIFSTVGKTNYAASKHLIKPGGYFLACDASAKDYGVIVRQAFGKLFGIQPIHQVIGGLAAESKDDLNTIKDIIEEGKFRAVIDRVYPIENIVDAHAYVEKGHKKGNVVLAV